PDAIFGTGDGLKREIKYDINDEVWNWADRHSKRTYIDVDAGGWRLDAPIIKEALNGFITIRDLNKQPVTIQIHVSSQYFAVGDSVKMTFIGTPPDNAEPLICSETRDIDNVPSVLEIEVPYELIRAIAQGRADASYILYKKDGGDPLYSKRTFASVVGDVNMLPEPSIRELLGDTLEPDELYATVDVRYAMKNGDLICLRWFGTKSDGGDHPHEVPHIVSNNEAKEGLVTFDINAEHIKVLENGTLDLSYVVANDTPGLLDIRESERLLAKVEKVRATLPAPEVEEADPPGDVLDPSKVFDRVHVWISEAKPLKGDVLTYYWRSPNPFASTSDWLPITTVTEGQPVRFPVDGKFVTANIGNSVKVLYTVWRAATQRNEYSAALDLRVAGWISPTLTDITDSKGTVAPGGITFDTSVTVTGKASPGQTVQLYDGNTALTPVVPVDANGDWSRVISGLSLAAHPIKAKALYGAQPESAVRSFTVAQTVTPTIVNITDSKGTVAPNGTTFDTSVTVTGKASP
ncbi:Ig-like domain repeat protein, partial [Pseudomonas sp. P155]